MRKNSVAPKFVLFLALTALPCLALAQDFDPNDPPQFEVDELALESGSVRAYRDDILQWVKHWARTIKDYDSQELTIKARTSLLQGYNRYELGAYRRLYARQAMQVLPALLKLDDTVKQINVGIVLSQMPEADVRDALKSMVTHSNPGLRYLGWRGYGRVRTEVLSLGQTAADDLLKTWSESIQQEKSPEVMSAAWDAFAVRSDLSVPDEVLVATRKKAFALVKKTWTTVPLRIRKGDERLAGASVEGIQAISTLWATVKEDKTTRTESLKLIVETMNASSLAYADANSTGPVAQANSGLLLACEEGLNAMMGFSGEDAKDLIQSSLVGTKGGEEKTKAVRLAVIRWIALLPDVEMPSDPLDAEKGKDSDD